MHTTPAYHGTHTYNADTLRYGLFTVYDDDLGDWYWRDTATRQPCGPYATARQAYASANATTTRG